MKLKDKYIKYDPTRVRQGDDVTAVTGAFSNERSTKQQIDLWINN